MRLSNHLSFGGASTKKVREMFSKDSGNACAKPWEAAGLTIYIILYLCKGAAQTVDVENPGPLGI